MLKQRALLAIGLILLVAVPLLPIGTDSFLTLLLNIFIVAALASSWNIVAGFAGQINLGHAAFFGLGALAMRLLWIKDYPFVLSFAAGGLVAAVAALFIGLPALRLRGIYFSIGTLALAEALELTVADVLPSVRDTALPGPFLREYSMMPRYYVAFAMLLVIVAVVYWLSRSRLGLGMMAVREDETAARSIGVNVFLHRLSAFVLSAFLAGLVGAAFAYYHPSYYAYLPFTPGWTFDALLVTFVGGIGTLGGPLLGAVFFVLIRDILASGVLDIHFTLFGTIPINLPLADFHLVIFGVIFILVVLVLPGGLVALSTMRGRWLPRRFLSSSRRESA
jgi:branched-chain amino acid transport system permease protein